jgi:VanZ family protein
VSRPPGLARFNFRFAIWTALYLVGLYGLSSLPDQPVRNEHAWLMLLSNLAHAPIFAGLAVLVFKTLSGHHGTPGRYVTAFAVTAAFGVIDEWHQSFVPGRTVSAGDLALDFAGGACALLIIRARQFPVRTGCEAE